MKLKKEKKYTFRDLNEDTPNDGTKNEYSLTNYCHIFNRLKEIRKYKV